MTLGEFRAWLDGYSASFTGGVPNVEQWAEVQRRLDLIAAEVVPPFRYPTTLYDKPRTLELRPADIPVYPYPVVTCGFVSTTGGQVQ